MVPRATNLRPRATREPLFDIHPQAGISIEVFFADRTLETFGRCGAGWFWCSRRPGFAPDGLATGPFATSYGAYRHAMKTQAPNISWRTNAWRTERPPPCAKRGTWTSRHTMLRGKKA
jgi:hypothetical protein